MAGSGGNTTLITEVDTLEENTDTLETLIASTNTKLDTLTTALGDVDVNLEAIETLVTAGNVSLADLQDALTADAATLSTVNDQDTNIQLLASNASRRGVIIHNQSAGILYVKYGATATATAGGYTYKLVADQHWEMPGPIYTGVIDGIWVGATTGAASITELT